MSITEQGEKQSSPLIISAGISNSAVSDRAKAQMLSHESDHKQWAQAARRFVPTSLTLSLMRLWRVIIKWE